MQATAGNQTIKYKFVVFTPSKKQQHNQQQLGAVLCLCCCLCYLSRITYDLLQPHPWNSQENNVSIMLVDYQNTQRERGPRDTTIQYNFDSVFRNKMENSLKLSSTASAFQLALSMEALFRLLINQTCSGVGCERDGSSVVRCCDAPICFILTFSTDIRLTSF